MKPLISIIILNWNGWKDTVECLESLFQITYSNYSVILIDNGSVDDSLEKIHNYCNGILRVESSFFKNNPNNKPIKIFEFSRRESEINDWKKNDFENIPSDRKLILIKNEKNYGFAEGNNIGIRFSLSNLKPDYIMLLNNDTVVDNFFLQYLTEKMANNESIGFSCPKIYYYDFNGKTNVINFAGGKIDMNRGVSSHIGLDTLDNGQFDSDKMVDWAEGSCILVKRNMIDMIGLLDRKYFAYLEELDWCLQGKKQGWQTWYVPKAKIWHKIARSTQTKSGRLIFFMTRNRIFFMRKNANNKEFFIFFTLFGIQFFKTLCILLTKKDKDLLKCFLKAVKDGFTN